MWDWDGYQTDENSQAEQGVSWTQHTAVIELVDWAWPSEVELYNQKCHHDNTSYLTLYFKYLGGIYKEKNSQAMVD